MKALYLVQPPLQGSRYKYAEMFGRVCDVAVRPAIGRTRGIDFAIIRGDYRDDYKAAMKAGLPYILIEHDVYTMRGARDKGKEREMIEGAAAVLFTSEAHLRYCAERYRLPPTRVVHLRPLARDIEFEPLPKLDGRNVVYAGGIVASGRAASAYGYRAYAREVFPAIIAAGWTVHVYPAWCGSDRGHDFERIGCVMHEPVPHADLYREMSQYQLGFHGYARSGPQDYIASCVPNKTWDSLGAGIPTIGFNPGASGAIYDGRWGRVARSLRDIPRALANAERMVITDEMRREQVMDGDIEAFRDLAWVAMTAGQKSLSSRRIDIRRSRRRAHIVPEEGTMRVIVTSAYKSSQRLHLPGEIMEVDADVAVRLFNASVAQPLPSEPERAVRPEVERRDYAALKMQELRATASERGLAVPFGVKKADLVEMIERSERDG